jgi:hypothetical protein
MALDPLGNVFISYGTSSNITKYTVNTSNGALTSRYTWQARFLNARVFATTGYVYAYESGAQNKIYRYFNNSNLSYSVYNFEASIYNNENLSYLSVNKDDSVIYTTTTSRNVNAYSVITTLRSTLTSALVRTAHTPFVDAYTNTLYFSLNSSNSIYKIPLDGTAAELTTLSIEVSDVGSAGQPVMTGLQLWLDANDPNNTGTHSYTDGNNFSVWYDKSGNARNATAFNVNGTYNTCVWSSSPPGIILNSSNESVNPATLVGPQLRSSIPSNTFSTAMTVFLVYRTIASNSLNTLFTRGNSTTEPNLGNPVDQFNNNYYLGERNSGRFEDISGAWHPVNTSLNLFTFVMNQTANSLTLFLNGSNKYTSTKTFTASDLGDRFILGGRVDNEPTAKVDMKVSEILVYNSVLSQASREQVELYLARKWNLTLFYTQKIRLNTPQTLSLYSNSLYTMLNSNDTSSIVQIPLNYPTTTFTFNQPIQGQQIQNTTGRPLTIAVSGATVNNPILNSIPGISDIKTISGTSPFTLV